MLRTLVSKCSIFLFAAAAIGLIGVVLLSSSDIIGRKFFNSPVPGTLEIVATLLVVIVFCSFIYAQIEGRHIVVQILVSRLKGKTRKIVEFFAVLLTFAFFALLTWHTGKGALVAWQIKEFQQGAIGVPTYPSKAILTFSCFLMSVHLFAELLDLLPLSRLRIIKLKFFYRRP